MNQAKLWTISAFLLFFISACQESEPTLSEGETPPYTPKAEDIVDMHGDIENIERFYQFIENIENNNPDEIRVVSYTVEGDPIIQDLAFDGEVIKTTVDSRRDEYGTGSIDTTTCQSIEVEEKAERKDYLLTGCKQLNIDKLILAVHKD